MKNKAAFTLIEILVVVGVLTVLVVSVGGIMGMTFKAKNSSEGNELLSSKAAYVLNELKRNILNANVNEISCSGADSDTVSVSFMTKDNGTTTLSCASPLIASASATNGTFYLLDNGIIADDCTDFVKCNIENNKVKSVEFVLRLRAPANVAGAGSTGVYYGVAVPRE